MIDAAERERCPICGAVTWGVLFRSGGYPIARCSACGLVRTLEVVEAGETQYPVFDQRETTVMLGMRALVEQLLRERMGLVRRVVPPGARLLDFGCGNGAFARLMARSGYDVVGIEPFSLGSPTVEQHLRLLRAPLEACAPTLGEFDVITMWQVLEHVRDPSAVLQSLLGHLQPGKVLVVSVPNFASWQSRLFGPLWFHLDPPRHISHFDRTALTTLLEKLDLEILTTRTFHLEYGPIGWIQSALNRVLRRPNFLYEFVKDRGALADVSTRETVANVGASLIASALMAVPALTLEALAAAAQAGSVLTMVARRRGGS